MDEQELELHEELDTLDTDASLFELIAERYRSGAGLQDEDIDRIADLALNVLKELLQSFGVDHVTIDEFEGNDGELIFDINGSDLAVLIGRHGRTLESLQMLFSLIVSRKIGFRFPIVVDIEGYKARRHDKVVGMAMSAADRAVSQDRSISLPAMSAYERRLVHISLRERADVVTHSEGMDAERHVVVEPV
ncbi:KH domain-containing protein [Collinsella sp. AGMB00827]|uniref:KH domain-containing protein n=1 Tax=Collinsella ureilytica TaxID=2869515 RepID=A0ABS7MKA3_9ACTN|nr:R3H domain-containing nucleic acid-binding protein [Collinsella urealyticum]MBY4797806.1 KH domain-containing protein [Collinsella urealyticum]